MTKLIVAFRSLTNEPKRTLQPERVHNNYLTESERASIVTLSLYLKNFQLEYTKMNTVMGKVVLIRLEAISQFMRYF
jgi:hypothetical protein